MFLWHWIKKVAFTQIYWIVPNKRRVCRHSFIREVNCILVGILCPLVSHCRPWTYLELATNLKVLLTHCAHEYAYLCMSIFYEEHLPFDAEYLFGHQSCYHKLQVLVWEIEIKWPRISEYIFDAESDSDLWSHSRFLLGKGHRLWRKSPLYTQMTNSYPHLIADHTETHASVLLKSRFHTTFQPIHQLDIYDGSYCLQIRGALRHSANRDSLSNKGNFCRQ